MKKIWLLLFCFLMTACSQPDDAVSNDRIYFFFATGCSHCHNALEYIDKNYPKLDLTKVNVGNRAGYDLLLRAAAKFKISGNLGTPLIVFGNDFIMGWGDTTSKKFDAKIKRFLRKNN